MENLIFWLFAIPLLCVLWAVCAALLLALFGIVVKAAREAEKKVKRDGA